MPSFTCACGYCCKDEESRYGVLFRLSALTELESRIAKEVAAYAAAGEAGKESFVRERFGKGYPPDLGDVEVIEDIVAQLVNDSRVRSVFECSDCGRIALCQEDGEWRFYTP